MTKAELANAIIERCNKEFDRKDPATKTFMIIHDMHDCYSDIYCLIDRFERSNSVIFKVKRKTKRDFLKEL
jgi:hypothetical protein